MNRVRLAALGVALGAVGALAIADAQQPRFGARVDVVLLDVNVVDDDGRPVQGLQPSDFSISVDGKPRRIASASFVSDTEPSSSGPATPEAAAPLSSSNEGMQRGRLILLLIDQDNIQGGTGRGAIQTAERFLDRLQPADRVGLLALPNGPRVEITADRAKVRAALAQVVGRETTLRIKKSIGLAEAFAIEDEVPGALDKAVARECAGDNSPICPPEVESEAQSLARSVRQRAYASLNAIRQLLVNLRRIQGPKTIVLVSESLVVNSGDAPWPDGIALLADISRAATSAETTIFGLHLDRPQLDMSVRDLSPTPDMDRMLRAGGMSQVVSAARGTLFNVVGTGDAVFNRIALELSAHYLVGFEAEGTDGDGRPHRVEVRTSRKGVHLRSRREFVVAPSGASADAGAFENVFASPFAATDVPLRVATYSVRKPDSSKIRLVISAEVAREAQAPQAMGVAFVVQDAKGKVVASGQQRVSLTPRGVRGPLGYVSSVEVEPGEYTLRLAVRDGEGRTGSVDHPVTARLAVSGSTTLSDLLLADEDAGEPGKWQPSVTAQLSGQVSGYVEIYSADKPALARAKVRFEVAENASGPALVTATARASEPDRAGARTVTGRVALDLLPPGTYVARAVAEDGDRVLGRVVRPFVVVLPSETAVTRPTVRTPPFGGIARRFDVQRVLAPSVVAPFLDRLTTPGAAPVTASVRLALARAKTGTFDDSLDKLAGGQDLPATFLRGLALLSQNDLERAAVEFRAALRLSSDFFPAAFYLGACYAAGGRDHEAVGAWQTTLAGESDMRVAYLALFETLGRMDDWSRALEVVRDATGQWPEDAELQRRRAAAAFMTGSPADALAVLRPYLAAHPDDTEALFLAMRAIVSERMRSADRAARGEQEEFARYAQLYGQANGSYQPLVNVWERYLGRADQEMLNVE